MDSKELLSLEPRFAKKVSLIISDMKAEGFDIGIHRGFRSVEEQDKIFAQGRTATGNIVTKARGGLSWHNYALAADLVFKVDGKWSWAESHPWAKIGELATKYRLEWGGVWRNPDRPHVQFTNNFSIRRALTLYKSNPANGLQAVWKLAYKE